MAENPTKYNELFDVKSIEKGLDQLSDSIASAIIEGRKKAAQQLTAVQGISPGTKDGQSDLKKQSAAVTSLTTKIKEQERIQKQVLTTRAKLSAVARGETEELKKLTLQLQRATKAQTDRIKEQNDFNDAAKKTPSFIKKMGDAFKSAGKQILAMGAASLGAAALLRGMFNVIKNGFKTTIEFEKSMSMVKAITGATGKDFDALRQSAINLGGSTAYTATQVAALQKEYAKLGFTNKEILKVTQGTLDLAAATGEDLATSAKVAGSTLRGFGLDATQMQRVVDVMAKSFTSSALDLNKFEVAMQKVAPVIAATGGTIESGTAKLAVLADAGLDASTAGTSLRNIYLELEKRGLTWDEAMNKLNTSQNKATTSLNLFGKRGAVAGLILADNTEKALEMEEAFVDAEGAASDMAAINLDNVAGQITMLKSAYEGLILRTNESSGALKNFLKTLTAVVSTINSDGIPAVEKLFGQEQVSKIETVNDRFQAFADLGYGTVKAWAAAKNTTNKAVEEMLAKGQQAYNERKALEDMQAEDEANLTKRITVLKQKALDKQNADIAKAIADQDAADKAQAVREKTAIAYREKISQAENLRLGQETQNIKRDIAVTGEMETGAAVLTQMKINDTNKEDQTRASEAIIAQIKKDARAEDMASAANAAESVLEMASQAIQSFITIFEASKQRELSAAGDNAEKREEIERKFFKKQQALNIALTIVEGAKGIAKAVAESPGTFGLPWSAFMAATTAAQIATISAQKFAEGGYDILGGNRHSEGGTMIPGIGEAEKGEGVGIFSRKATRQMGGVIPDIVNAINNGKFYDTFGRATSQLTVNVDRDPYTKKMYDILKRTPISYKDSNGDYVILYPDGNRDIIKQN